jgi:hypothetical protein
VAKIKMTHPGASGGPARQSAHHQHFSVRKVDQVDDAVHHGVAQGHQGVHAAHDEAVDDLLEEDVH